MQIISYCYISNKYLKNYVCTKNVLKMFGNRIYTKSLHIYTQKFIQHISQMKIFNTKNYSIIQKFFFSYFLKLKILTKNQKHESIAMCVNGLKFLNLNYTKHTK